MGNLFISFSIAIGVAVSLVVLSRQYDLDFYTSRIFPLIPILYALVYQALEKVQTGRTPPRSPSRSREGTQIAADTLFRGITAGRIAAGVGVSFGVKFAFEALYTALFFSFSGEAFSRVYGTFGIETVGRFLRGDHPWLSDSEGIALLILLAVTTSFATGIWIGSTTRGRAMLEGVLVGAIVTLTGAITNMLVLYLQIEETANRMAAAFGFAAPIGFVVVITSQVLLYGLWSEIARRARDERALSRSLRKAARAPKK